MGPDMRRPRLSFCDSSDYRKAQRNPYRPFLVLKAVGPSERPVQPFFFLFPSLHTSPKTNLNPGPFLKVLRPSVGLEDDRDLPS